ncbi:M3 family metallopeptidase [Janthinobacterium fluminis]|uniref:Zn-dependent oligopeptidase n=1 Tax=Janthinobacterium fluminis TaxID=2987524 RepID=A0ABT5K6W3_9BURK|nr:M3 family metallopeptidase [Janthinobacterium fluminis]MDC8760521.1 Zn-dependent oligopeptidase [Janthinobacterium fluminis]
MHAERHPVRWILPPLLALACAALPAAPALAAAPADPLHAWVAGDDTARLEKWVDGHLAAARVSIARLLAARGPRTVANTLQPYDEAQNQLSLAGNQAYLLYSVGRSAALRDKAQALNRKVASASADLNLNRGVYQALAAVAAPAGDAATRRYLERTLLVYRLAGVDQDEATRARLHALQDKITALSLTFGRNVQDGTLKVSATRAELDGLPDDYIARHQPDADGMYTLTTDEPDTGPVFDFAHSAELRRRMYLAYTTRAYPANRAVLLELLAARQELAGILGFANYADYATADQMMGNAANVRKLFEEVEQASREARQREYAQLLAFAQRREPTLTAIAQSDANYWVEQYRRERYAFDAQSVRPYFAYERVEAGILDAAAKIFRVRFQAVKDARVWHPSVTVFDVFDGARKVGRVYLDMHPREGKDKWFSSSPVVPGIRGRQVPEGMLVCNFSGGTPGDPGLMRYNEVLTYFHEFGHLLHHILGSQNRWSGQGGFNVEGDFVEAPSQMLEEFFRSHKVLAPFARHYQSGAVLPAETMARMNAANAFGRGNWAQRQLLYASLSLHLHDRPVAEVDPDALLRASATRYSPYTFVEGNRLYANFTHLTGYSSNYYTYVLDKVIAIDFASRFDRADPLAGPAAAQYRKAVIDPGASKPAAQLVRDFLGRPQNMDAFKAWLGEQFQEAAR